MDNTPNSISCLRAPQYVRSYLLPRYFHPKLTSVSQIGLIFSHFHAFIHILVFIYKTLSIFFVSLLLQFHVYPFLKTNLKAISGSLLVVILHGH